MGSELINRITIKKDGVYVSTHSSNDTSPFHSVKVDYLTSIYNTEGQAGLDKAIIDLCFYNCQLRGNHKSIVIYKEAIEKAIYDKDFIEIRNEYDELSNQAFNIANGFNKYQYLSKEQRDELYNEIKPKVEIARNKRNKFVANFVEETRSRNKEKPSQSITVNFGNLLSEMKNKELRIVLGIGNSINIIDAKGNLYNIEIYYDGSYIDKIARDYRVVTFNLIETTQAEHLKQLYASTIEILDFKDVKHILDINDVKYPQSFDIEEHFEQIEDEKDDNEIEI